ncbi:hypothetical protein TNCV_4430281 [Trichonephila clavipes]|nr:hypothetical protein TNCV_4430281 [Trichonephila clavipes]
MKPLPIASAYGQTYESCLNHGSTTSIIVPFNSIGLIVREAWFLPDHSRHPELWSNVNLDVCEELRSPMLSDPRKFGLAIHQNDHQARRRFVEWAQNEIAVVPDFHMRILFSDEAHFWSNGYINKQNCRIWSEANPQVYVETPLHPEKLTVWCALWAGGIFLHKR